MQITVNGKEKKVSVGLNLNQLINQVIQDKRRVIAEVNGEIVKNTLWEKIILKSGDTIELINLVGGG